MLFIDGNPVGDEREGKEREVGGGEKRRKRRKKRKQRKGRKKGRKKGKRGEAHV
jgi:hypothetical protein